MKELSIEEKARRYDEAIKRANELLYVSDKESLQCKIIESILPELAESEDERIRIELLNYLYDVHDDDEERARWIAYLEKQGEHANFRNKIQIGDKVTRNQDGILVNLSQLNRVTKNEKQGEQKPACNVKPKFKDGDWVVYKGDICQIVKREEGCNKLVTNYGIEKELVNERNLSTARLWTIQDAKDGDVLCCESGWTCIFRALDNHTNTFSSYCFMDNTGWFCETGIEAHTLEKAFIKAYNGNIYPATKEQRDFLFQKMKEVGYEWDAENKELKKIEQKNEIDIPFGVKDGEFLGASYCIPEGFHAEIKGNRIFIKKGEQKSSWSEEDARLLDNCISLIEDIDCTKEEQNWLKGIKDRVQLKQEWSEEDVEILQQVIADIEDLIATETGIKFLANYHRHLNWLKSLKNKVQPQPKQEWSKEYKDYYDAIISKLEVTQDDALLTDNQMIFLKSLRPQNTWKPSDEQLKQLEKYCPDNRPLTSLYEQLKKLKD